MHKSVLLSEAVNILGIQPGGVYLDMTVGGFGHGAAIASQLSSEGTYIGLDLDSEAIERARQLSRGYKCKFVFCQTHLKRFAEILVWNGINKLDGCLMDLGMSSLQLDDSRRGFSFLRESDLDMRMDARQALTAYEVVNSYPVSRLKDIFYTYGEERFAPQISAAIDKARRSKPIATTLELASIVDSAIPQRFHAKGRHPATKAFQAIRIEVNDEINPLGGAVREAMEFLREGGRIAAISFHSLEDRAIKSAFAECARGCTCPKDFPICVCGKTPLIRLLTKKPVVPTESEVALNPRSRSARLRAAEKLKSIERKPLS
ncbi:MAG: 16S rRNA (cytosine(1402)-N(4))-methyltransferase RsmH [Eubacteriaceae bacterium]|jgi:16S rRNA (cytosine1402-N4)-methyltransferase|nr:16S rRNA (cytosine(1402)-N(4))-methyltransferase RsmH [Eubacteriaceae bacterium]